MSMRLRRLQADYERLQARCDRSPHLLIRSAKGNPPEQYEIALAVKGLCVDSRDQIVETTNHVAEIVLTSAYPRQAPKCRMITPIFHPNVDSASICIGDHWAASESLDDLVVRIAEIITYQSYNTKSPLNGEAARWADQNEALLPIDPVDLWPSEDMASAPNTAPAESSAQGRVCANCGAAGPQAGLERDNGDRWICADCAARCPSCSGLLIVGEELCRGCQRRVASIVDESATALIAGNAAKAIMLLDAGLREFPQSGVLSRDKQKLVKVNAEIDNTMAALKHAIQNHRYFLAQELFNQLALMPVEDDELEPAKKIVDARCTRATWLARRGKQEAKHDVALAKLLLRRALQVAPDCSEAAKGLEDIVEMRKRAPHLESEFLNALSRADAAGARASLTDLLYVVSLPSDELAQVDDQVSHLEKAKNMARLIFLGSLVVAVLLAIVTAILIGTRGA